MHTQNHMMYYKIENIPTDHRIVGGDINFVFDVLEDKMGKPETNIKKQTKKECAVGWKKLR